ncbi:MAG TPA: amidohydrolase/deacetylase family metallohydrolase [Bryobacteraceae bacterium]|nr:amidohydrolase/deacetylase family metallohydrolase [Bryobacteraceae bacterium]
MTRSAFPIAAALLAACVIVQPAFGQTSYDLLLKGGHVIDPKNKINSIRDVAVANGRIAAVAPDIPASLARKVVNVQGLYVTPGLVDIHAHVFTGLGAGEVLAGGNESEFPDGFTLRNGVTTVVDAGSSGHRNFERFKAIVIDRARTRVLAFLNIVGYGMSGEPTFEQDLKDMDAAATAHKAEEHKDLIVGIKVAHYNGPEWTPVERGVEAGTLANIPVMVDFGKFRPERPFQELVLKKLRPGDIYTHTYLGRVPMLDDNGRVLPYLFAARKRGIIFDVGHGGASLLFRLAVPALQQGFPPDSISTDLHSGSMNAGMKDMLNVMSKFLNMGLSLDDVILRSTWNPAREIRREEFGNLSAGAPADIAVLRVEKGDFGFVDSYGARLAGNQRLACELTVRDGLVMYDLNGITRDDWRKLGKYGPQGNPEWDATRESYRPRARR